MSDAEPKLKLFTKTDFNSVRNKFVDISPKADEIIEHSNDTDVLVLLVKEGSAFSVLDAKVLNEEAQETFIELLKKGTAAFE